MRHGYDPTAASLVEDFDVERLAVPLTDVASMDELIDVRRRVSSGTLDAAICEDAQRRPSILLTSFGEIALTRDHLVSGLTPVCDVITRLDSIPALVVVSEDRSYGLLTQASLNSVAARSWLFGLVTLLEIKLRTAAEMKVIDWRSHISPERLAKAREVKEERMRRGQTMATIDGLQFSDLGTIALKDEELFASLGIESKRAGRQFIKRLESLRNNLAHAQDLVAYDWETILMIARNARRIVAPSG